MLDSYHKHQIHNKIKFNSISGTLVKSHPDSWFERFGLKSKRAEIRFDQNAKFITLQTMVVWDMEVLAEIVRREDYFAESEEK